MRLVTYHEADELRIGVVHGEQVVDVQRWLSVPSEPLPTEMIDLIALEEDALIRIRQRLDLIGDEALAGAPRLDVLRLAAPIPRPRKNVMCIGLNYRAHAAEQGKEPPERPAVFTKAPTSVIGPHDAIPVDATVTEKLDWEVELAFIIGRGGRGIKAAQALDHVFGYTVINDVSARDVQNAHGGQFFLGKSLDGTCPMGPWILTRDEIADPQALRVTAHVNGALKQDSNTADMVFPVAELIEWLSKGMTLEPGDIISTGTPGGVGAWQRPPQFLHPGDVVEVTVEGIGTLRNPVVAWGAA